MATLTAKRRPTFSSVRTIPTALDRAPEIARRAAEVRAETDKARRVEKALALADYIVTGK